MRWEYGTLEKRGAHKVLWRSEFLREMCHLTPEAPVHALSLSLCVCVWLIMAASRLDCLLQLLSVDVVACRYHTDLVLFLLIQDAKEVVQLGDGESVPLQRKRRTCRSIDMFKQAAPYSIDLLWGRKRE